MSITNSKLSDKHITFLIGSGFSIHCGFPSTNVINRMLVSLKEGDFSYDTTEVARFLKGAPYPNNEFEHLLQRKFFVALKDFYIKYILRDVDKFHYEDFYDYFNSDAYNLGLEYLNFYNQFKIKNHDHFIEDYDCKYLLHDVDLILQGLVSNLIKEVKQESSHLCSPYSPNLKNFLSLIELIPSNYTVHIATLNHDCYMERLNYSDAFAGNLEDGFNYNGSPFYGRLQTYNKNINYSISPYFVRLPVFVDNFCNRFRLYKLHGGVDQYWYSDQDGTELIKVMNFIDRFRISREIFRNGSFSYSDRPVYPLPNVLNGTKSKIRNYEGQYFKTLFKRFEQALYYSNILVIAGYGFRDDEINKYITRITNLKDKTIFVVDIVNSVPSKMASKNIIFLHGGVEKFSINKILTKL